MKKLTKEYWKEQLDEKQQYDYDRCEKFIKEKVRLDHRQALLNEGKLEEYFDLINKHIYTYVVEPIINSSCNQRKLQGMDK